MADSSFLARTLTSPSTGHRIFRSLLVSCSWNPMALEFPCSGRKAPLKSFRNTLKELDPKAMALSSQESFGWKSNKLPLKGPIFTVRVHPAAENSLRMHHSKRVAPQVCLVIRRNARSKMQEKSDPNSPVLVRHGKSTSIRSWREVPAFR